MSQKQRFALGIAVFLLGLCLVLPIWRIEIWAPQYPEGLLMQISANKIEGSVQAINILNHYIGMKRIVPAEIPELTIIPWVLGILVILGALVVFLNKTSWARAWFALVCFSSAVGMADFYRWGYNYGHDLSPTAPIKIPGLSYQPPLIGGKTLLNIHAYSLPDWGGWALVFSLLIAFFAIFWGPLSKTKLAKTTLAKKICPLIILISLFGLSSCSAKPEPLKVGVDHCEHCHMQISDVRFGAEIVTAKGRQYKFDTIQCMREFKVKFTSQIKGIFVEDYFNPGTLIDIETAYILTGSQIKGPMGPGPVASKDEESLKKLMPEVSGQLTNWKDLSQSSL